MSNLELFNAEAAAEAQRRGMSRALTPHGRKELLCAARLYAAIIARAKGSVTIDDVQARMIEMGMAPEDLGNAAGHVFRGDEWEACGVRKSTRVSTHARRILIWRLR